MSSQTTFIPNGGTSVTVDIALVQNAAGTGGNPYTGLTGTSTTLTCYYRNAPGLAPTAVTLVAMTSGTNAYTSGGLVEIDSSKMPGSYRFDIPNALVPTSGEANFVFAGSGLNLAAHTLKVIPVQQMFLGVMDGTSYGSAGTAYTPQAALQFTAQLLSNFKYSGTFCTIFTPNGTSTAAVLTLDNSANPSSGSRTT
jgi:hypothetical protein